MVILLGDVKIEITRAPRQGADDAAKRTYEIARTLKAYEDARRMYEVEALRYAPWLR